MKNKEKFFNDWMKKFAQACWAYVDKRTVKILKQDKEHK